MGHMIDKIQKMDKISVGLELLSDDLRKCYEENFQEQWRLIAYNRLTELKNYSEELQLEITGVLVQIQGLIVETLNEELYTTVDYFLQKTREIFSKLYLYNIHSEETYKEECIENYYGTEYEKNALLVYILRPFIFKDMVPDHTNQVEARIIAEVLSQKGYNVDLVNSKYVGKLDAEKYNLVIGTGKPFEELCNNHGQDTIAIYYLTGSSSYFANMAELKRMRYFEERNHYMPRFERLSLDLLDLSVLVKADAAICLGNEHTVSTYDGTFSHIYPLNVTGFSDCTLPAINKKVNNINFLWYGGAGPIHKGLDLCMEAFRELPQLNLYIVGDVTNEFYELYREDFENSENILYYGFLRKDSAEFQQVCESCDFCICPSCSEGQSTAVVSTMFSGIIPVCTKETGIDVVQAGGFEIVSIEISELVQLIRGLSELPLEEVEARQRQVYEYASTNHSVENYKKSFSEILDNILGVV